MEQTLYLAHHGILGQKWGIRRYQNFDGTLTPAGKQRYAKDISLAEKEKGSGYLKRQNDRSMVGYKEVFNKREDAGNKLARQRFNELYDKDERNWEFDKNGNVAIRKDLIRAGKKYLNEMASIRLERMGYEANKNNIDYLKKQDWFQKSLDINLYGVGVGVVYDRIK